MKPCDFAYVRPSRIEEALEILDEFKDRAQVLAGGQSLIPTLNMRLSAPEVVVDINDLTPLKGINVQDGAIRVGALTRHAEVEGSPIIAEHLPLLAKAITHVAHPAIRNRGTIGGSIALADPAAEMPACAVALGADLVLRGPKGTRRVAAADFFIDLFETELAEGEILEAIEFPIPAAGSRHAFGEFARRRGDYALVGLAAQGDMANGVVTSISMVFFGVGSGPVAAKKAAGAMAGRAVTPALIEAAMESLEEELDPMDDLNASSAMKRHLAKVLAGRLLGEWVA